MGCHIRSLGAYVPQKSLSNDDLSQMVETSDEWIFSHTGIKNRHIAADDEAASDLAVKAARECLQKAHLKAEDLDMIIVATATPDYNSFPSTACIVQDKIGALNAGAFDLVAGCTGFVYALDCARGLISQKANGKALVIGTEILSRILDWKDRNTCVLFGDGAGAALLENSSKDGGIQDSILRSQGSGAQDLVVPHGGSRRPFNEDSSRHNLSINMNGKAVYNFAVKAISNIILEMLERNKLSMDQIDWIVPHQANVRIIQAACKRMDWPMTKFFLNLMDYANTSAASVPLALYEMQENGLLKKGQKILTVAFGAGLTLGGNYLIW